jgi:hypothetical protein
MKILPKKMKPKKRLEKLNNSSKISTIRWLTRNKASQILKVCLRKNIFVGIHAPVVKKKSLICLVSKFNLYSGKRCRVGTLLIVLQESDKVLVKSLVQFKLKTQTRQWTYLHPTLNVTFSLCKQPLRCTGILKL